MAQSGNILLASFHHRLRWAKSPIFCTTYPHNSVEPYDLRSFPIFALQWPTETHTVANSSRTGTQVAQMNITHMQQINKPTQLTTKVVLAMSRTTICITGEDSYATPRNPPVRQATMRSFLTSDDSRTQPNFSSKEAPPLPDAARKESDSASGFDHGEFAVAPA